MVSYTTCPSGGLNRHFGRTGRIFCFPTAPSRLAALLKQWRNGPLGMSRQKHFSCAKLHAADATPRIAPRVALLLLVNAPGSLDDRPQVTLPPGPFYRKTLQLQTVDVPFGRGSGRTWVYTTPHLCSSPASHGGNTKNYAWLRHDARQTFSVANAAGRGTRRRLTATYRIARAVRTPCSGRRITALPAPLRARMIRFHCAPPLPHSHRLSPSARASRPSPCLPHHPRPPPTD